MFRGVPSACEQFQSSCGDRCENLPRDREPLIGHFPINPNRRPDLPYEDPERDFVYNTHRTITLYNSYLVGHSVYILRHCENPIR